MDDRLGGGLALLFLASAMVGAQAQIALPTLPKPTGAELFKQQCQTCHTLNAGEPSRQGPLLAGVIGRKPGSVPGFPYSAGYAKAEFVWDDTHLDTYLADPQAVIPGAVMPYRQQNAGVRAAIIAFLKEQK